MNSDVFVKLSPTKLFFRCAVPAVITSVSGALYSVVDGMFVGRFLGEDALAAVNLIMPVIMIVEAISNMIATGSSVSVSMLLGAGNREEASRVFSFSIKFIIAFSCLVSIAGFIFAKPFVVLLSPGATDEAVKLTVEYLKVYALFGPLVPIYYATDNYLRVCGKERVGMRVGIVSQLINVVLDYVFIVVLDQGIRAAAAASCISIVFGSAVTLAMFTGKRMVYLRGWSSRQLLSLPPRFSSCALRGRS